MRMPQNIKSYAFTPTDFLAGLVFVFVSCPSKELSGWMAVWHVLVYIMRPQTSVVKTEVRVVPSTLTETDVKVLGFVRCPNLNSRSHQSIRVYTETGLQSQQGSQKTTWHPQYDTTSSRNEVVVRLELVRLDSDFGETMTSASDHIRTSAGSIPTRPTDERLWLDWNSPHPRPPHLPFPPV